MDDKKVQWTLDLIDTLKESQIGDESTLDTIKNTILNEKNIHDSDREYLKEKFQILQKTNQQKTQRQQQKSEERSKINDENNIDYEANSSFPGIKLTIPKKDINKSGIRVAVSSLGVNHATKEFIDSELNDQVCSSFSGSLKFGALADGTASQ